MMLTMIRTHKTVSDQPMPGQATLPSGPAKRRRLRPILIGLAGLVLCVPLLYYRLAWPWLSHWGAQEDEIQKALPGDELVPNPAFVTTKAITIAAPPAAIYP